MQALRLILHATRVNTLDLPAGIIMKTYTLTKQMTWSIPAKTHVPSPAIWTADVETYRHVLYTRTAGTIPTQTAKEGLLHWSMTMDV